MDEIELVVELPASAGGTVPDIFFDAPSHEVVGEDEFPPSGQRDGGVGFHGYEAIFSVPSVGEASVGCQISVEVVDECFWSGGKEFSSVASGGAVGVGGSDGVRNVNGASACC